MCSNKKFVIVCNLQTPADNLNMVDYTIKLSTAKLFLAFAYCFLLFQPFHFSICNWSPKKPIPYKILMESIAAYINKLPRLITRKVMQRICLDVFGSCSHNKVVKMMRAYYAYTPRPTYG